MKVPWTRPHECFFRAGCDIVVASTGEKGYLIPYTFYGEINVGRVRLSTGEERTVELSDLDIIGFNPDNMKKIKGIAETCPRCHVMLESGQALISTVICRSLDMGEAVTMSTGGPGKLIPVLKCPSCGYSRTP